LKKKSTTGLKIERKKWAIKHQNNRASFFFWRTVKRAFLETRMAANLNIFGVDFIFKKQEFKIFFSTINSKNDIKIYNFQA